MRARLERGGWAFVLVLAAGLGGALAGVEGASAQDASGGTPVARVGDEVITLEELEEGLEAQLGELERRRYALLQGRLEALIGERLIAREAARRGVSVDQLRKEEVYAKAPEVPDSEVTAFIRDNRERLPQTSDQAALFMKVWDFLRAQRVRERQQAYVASLRAGTRVSVSLPEPPALRAAVDASTGAARGPAGALVVIVEFSDFQCPFCRRLAATAKRLHEIYPTEVRWVFRDFPIEELHPGVSKAHEAARCAGAQGKFWEYHDLLFERTPRPAPQELARLAQEAGLDATGFARCLETGAQRDAVARDLADGRRHGVRSTPTFFVNGRRVVGAKPLAEVKRLIEEELERHRSSRRP